jgi:hypothetical protein
MKKMFFCAAAICCSALFAQEAAVAPAVAPAPVANTDSVQTVAPAETPVAAPAAEAANAAAPVADTAKVAAPAVETAKVDTVKAAEPVAAPVAEVAQVEDTAKVAEADTSKWSKFVGVSLTVPFESYKAGGKKINFINYEVSATYVGVCRCGFTPKASISAGIATAKKIPFYPSKGWQVGSFSTFEVGAGYSFVNSEKLLLSGFAVVGFEYANFITESKKMKHSELGNVDRDYLESFSSLTLGGDVMARFALNESVGLFASVGGRWVAYTDAESAVRYTKDDYTRTENIHDDGVGYFSIVPSFGVMWKI